MVQLETRQLCKTYPSGVQALEDVGFTLERGTFLSVIGPSGAGKTTLFRILNGMERADSGQVLHAGQRFEQARGRKRRAIQKTIGTIYQDFCLADMNLLTGSLGLFPKDRREEAEALLEQVGLGDKRFASVQELSGGQKQRVAIARALMRRPALLLADEPVASLDPVTGRQIVELLRNIQQRQGVTVLMNSHNLELARTYSDRLLGLREGRVVFDGPPDALDADALFRVYGGRSA